MGTPFITKGTTIQLSSGSTELKAVIIEDPDIVVGEAENNKLTASDGTGYTFAGQEGDNELTLTCVMTHDTISALLTSVYGAGTSAGSSGTSWDLISAGGTTQNIQFIPPSTSGNQGIIVTAINAKGLVAKPMMELGTGWKIEVKYTCDKYRVSYDSNTLG